MNQTMEDKKVAAAVAGVRLRRGNSVPSSVKIPRKFTLSTTTTTTTNHNHHTTPPIESIPNGNHHHSITPTTDCELTPLKYPSYTSLRDLLPSSPSVLSPSAAASVLFNGAASSSASSSGGSIAATANTCSGCEISIRNRLVKQAAWAYLQPMSSSPSSSGRNLWSWSRWWCLCVDSLKQFLVSVRKYIVEMMTSVSGWLADALWLIFCR